MNHEHFIRYKKIGRKKNKLGAFDSLKNSNLTSQINYAFGHYYS